MLQGSLDNFALDEVLGLLSNTNKTGQLDIKGNRGSGSLTFSDGSLVAAKASYTANGTEIEDVMFEMLRYEDGTFSFTSREVQPTERNEDVTSVVAGAESRLGDWRQIEAVVPSLNHLVSPVADLPSEEVTINRDEWAALIVIAAGCPASVVCERLEVGEVEGSRQIKNLAERELVKVGDPSGSSTSKRAKQPPAPPKKAKKQSPSLGDVLGDGADRPPMPPTPGVGDLGTAPPSPSEINEFKDGVQDASELVDNGKGDHDGGLLMKYLKNDD